MQARKERNSLPENLLSDQRYAASVFKTNTSSLIPFAISLLSKHNPLETSWKNWTSCANIPHARTHAQFSFEDSKAHLSNFAIHTVKPVVF